MVAYFVLVRKVCGRSQPNRCPLSGVKRKYTKSRAKEKVNVYFLKVVTWRRSVWRLLDLFEKKKKAKHFMLILALKSFSTALPSNNLASCRLNKKLKSNLALVPICFIEI